MLDVHAPHEPIHTWKSFFIHIATIVVGLLIAVGLEQAVELVHHRHQVAETRESLRLERDSNRKNFVKDSRLWRWETVELENNLLVLQIYPVAPRNAPGSAARHSVMALSRRNLQPRLLEFRQSDRHHDTNAGPGGYGSCKSLLLLGTGRGCEYECLGRNQRR